MFGEDACLEQIFSNSGKHTAKPSIYNVTCETNDSEILYANISDIFKLVKNE